MAEEIAHFKLFSKAKYRSRLVYIDPELAPAYSPGINPFVLEDLSERNIALMTQELKAIFKVMLA